MGCSLERSRCGASLVARYGKNHRRIDVEVLGVTIKLHFSSLSIQEELNDCKVLVGWINAAC